MSEEKVYFSHGEDVAPEDVFTCEFCGAKTKNLINAVNDSGGTQLILCDECSYNVINMLAHNPEIRALAKRTSW